MTTFLTLAEAAEQLKCSLPTLRLAVANGKVPSVRVGKRTIRISGTALERLGLERLVLDAIRQRRSRRRRLGESTK